jgi:hypothetical protein
MLFNMIIIIIIQLGIEKYISNNEQQGLPPTRAAVFFDLSNMFNNISRVEFLESFQHLSQNGPLEK